MRRELLERGQWLRLRLMCRPGVRRSDQLESTSIIVEEQSYSHYHDFTVHIPFRQRLRSLKIGLHQPEHEEPW